MIFSNVVFLDDLLRENFIHSRAFIYQLIREPIKQILKIPPPDLRKFPIDRGLNSSFQKTIFQKLCNQKNWIENYLSIPDAAAEYLLNFIPNNSIIIGYEMPPWLVNILKSNNLKWINIRLSPIRFSRDLYLVLQSSSFNLRSSIKDKNVTEEEIQLEAGLMRASVLHNSLASSSATNTMDNCVLFIGQTRSDASLISENGTLLKVEDFTEEIVSATENRIIIYKPHPSDKSWAKLEKKKLEKITKTKIRIAREGTYSLLAGNTLFDVMGISSGVLQEAEYFDRNAIILHRPVCDFKASECCHVRFMDFASPSLWLDILGGDLHPLPQAQRIIPTIQPNMMRNLHNAWWGYSEYMIENNKFLEDLAYNGLKRKASRVWKNISRKLF